MSAAAANGPLLLELDDVTTYYGQMRILEGISLQVRAGELVCLLVVASRLDPEALQREDPGV